MTSTSCRSPSAVTIASGSMWSIPVRIRSTFWRVRAAQPAAVVLERALPGGRVVRDHLGEELRIVADLALDPVGEHEPRAVVEVADRDRGIALVVRVDPGGFEALLASGPEDEEPVPAPVERQVLERPADPGADGVVIVGVREHPLRGALEDREVFDAIGDRRGDLEAARTGPDHGDALSGQVEVVVPPCGVERRPAEGVLPGISGIFGRLSWPTAEMIGPGL